MRSKYLYTILLIFCIHACYAQWYMFTEFKDTFKGLDSNSISLIYSETDDCFESYSVPIGFNFKFHDLEFNTLNIANKCYYFNAEFIGVVVVTMEHDTFNIGPSFYYFGENSFYNPIQIQLYTSDLYPVPKFPIQYKYITIGNPGERIFILESDIGYYFTSLDCYFDSSETCTIDSTEQYNTKYQLWLYENNGDIAIHFGQSLLPDYIISFISISKNQRLKTTLFGNNDVIQSRFGECEDYYIDGWPNDSTVLKFSFNNSNQIFLNEYSKPFIYSEIIPEFGAIIGHNGYKDYEWAEKFHVPMKMQIKGIICQNYGAAHSNESASFSIYSSGQNILPKSLIYRTKRTYSCLKLDENINYIGFDTIVTVDGFFYVAFGLEPYNTPLKDTIGLCNTFFSENEYFSVFEDDFNRTVVRNFNDEWVSIYALGYLSDFLNDISRDNDLIHFALAPVVNFDLNNQTLIHDSLDCKLNISNLEFNHDITVYPIPTNNTITISFSLNSKSDGSLLIFNNTGVVIDGYQLLQMIPGNYQKEINVSNYPDGLYYVIIKLNNKTKYAKFIVQK